LKAYGHRFIALNTLMNGGSDSLGLIYDYEYDLISYLTIWYPDWDFYLKVHHKMLAEFGGHPGVRRSGKYDFEVIMNEVRATRGTYVKAGIMLYRLRRARLVDDAVKRTAYTVTTMFLEENKKTVFETNVEKALEFVEDMLEYDLKDVIEWLKNGRLPKEKQRDPRPEKADAKT